jgi:hypothetical protein
VQKQHEVQWWHRDSAHTRWEVTQPVARSGSPERSSFVADGQNAWYIHPNRLEANYTPLDPDANQSVSSLLLFGPTYQSDIPALLAALRGGWGSEGHVEVIGREVILGRETVIIEFGVEDRYWSNEGWFLTKLNRWWVDPETMMLLRHESDSGRFVAQITRLDYGTDSEDEVFRYEPPDAFAVARLPTIDPNYKPDPYAGMKLLAPFFRPGYIPAGFEVRELMAFGLGDDGSKTEAFLRSENGDWVRLEQTLTAGGMPQALMDRLGRAVPATFRGVEALEDDAPRAAQLGWFQDGIAFMLSSNSVDVAELRRIGEGLVPGPPPHPDPQ